MPSKKEQNLTTIKNKLTPMNISDQIFNLEKVRLKRFK